MKIKHLVISILMILSCAAASIAQSPPATAGGTDKRAAVAQALSPNSSPIVSGVSETPALKTEDLLKIRDLQYSQAKRALQMKQYEAAYRQLQDDQMADARRIDDVIREAAKGASVDIEKWSFDADALKFVPRSPPATAGGSDKAAKPKS